MELANNYRQFIPHFSTLKAPIFALAKIWRMQRMHSLAFASATVLYCPDPDKSFFLEVETSSIRAGTVLSQRNI